MVDKKIKSILINEDLLPPGLDILTRFKSFVELRIGYSNILDKIIQKYPNAKLYYRNANHNINPYFLSRHPNIFPDNQSGYDLEITPEGYQPWDMIQNVPGYLEEDLVLSKEIGKWKSKIKSKLKKYEIVGKEKYLYVHPSANIYPGVVIDTTGGPVIVDKEAKITSFSYIEGPVYIGTNTQVDNARITSGTIIGKNCRIGGEVGNSIIQDYSNKHHEGFLGHSVLGSWVNMGALSTTSDLKNNYGIIEIQSGNSRVNTGTIKFGSVVGDFSKIGIGVMINTGSTIDVGCNLVDSRFSGYLPPFSWIHSDTKYRLDRFIRDTKKIMSRRSVEMSEDLEALIGNVYNLK